MSPEEISQAIRQGSMAFLKKEYKILSIFILITSFLLFYFLSWKLAIAFISGSVFSALAGNIGMRAATKSNLKTAMACKKDLVSGLKAAFNGGSIIGLSVVILGISGIGLLYYIFRDAQVLYGFGFGASAIALFARVGGGIYTKAADVGADLVGKVEKNMPEDDPRNPAVIADNVGDNVGDVAGMGADLFESYVDSIIAAMAMAGLAILQPILLAVFGIIASLVGIIIIQIKKSGEPHRILNTGIFTAGLIFAIGSYFLVKNTHIFIVILFGLLSGIIIGLTTQYYTSSKFRPTKNLAKSAKTGAGTNVISGLALGMQSTVIPVLIISGTILLSYKLVGIYGIALSAVGMLSTLAITLSSDSYGPIADNAAGIAEMGFMGKETRERAEELDAVGNTTAAIGKGFAIGSAALTASVLAMSYAKIAHINTVNILNPTVLVALFIGGLMPFIFSSLTMQAVGKSAQTVISEARKQFKHNPDKPDYKSCIDIVTGAALKQMIMPALLAIVTPVAIGFLLGKVALVGLLTGAIVSGFVMAIMMANAGGAWDNAKKFIESGKFGGKGSATHKAAIIGDTVGDPFKDTAGPSLNILIKLMSIIALVIAPLL